MKNIYSFALAAGALLPATQAWAQTIPVSSGLVMEDIIFVTATRGEQIVDETAVSVSVIDRETLRNTPGATLDELLRNVPGIQLPLSNQNTNFPVNPSIAIRGLGLGDNGTRTLVLIDGTPANGGFFGNVYWNRTPLNGIDRVEVVRGGGSGVYGAFAQGGVVNIITKAPTNDFTLYAEGRAGSFESYGGDISVSGPISKRLRGVASIGYEESDGFFEIVEEQRGVIDTRTSHENENYRVQMEFDATDNILFYVRGGSFQQVQSGTSRISQNSSEVHDVVAGIEVLFGSSKIESQIFYQNEEFIALNPRANADRSSEFLSFNSVTGSEDIGGSFVWTYKPTSIFQSVSVGLDGRLIDGDNAALTFRPDGEIFLDEQSFGKQRSIGVFAEFILSPFDGNEITVNLREDFYRNSDARIIQDGVARQLPNTSLEEFSFRFAMRQSLSEHFAVRGSAYRSFRAPTLSELYRSFGSSSFQGRANPLLTSETLIGGEIGVQYTNEKGHSIELNVFHNAVDDFVGSVPVAFSPVFTVENTNLGRIRSRGAEVIGRFVLTDHLTASAGYVHLDAEVIENPIDVELVNNRGEGAPEHSITWGLQFSDWHGLTVDLRGRYLSEQFQDIGNETRLGDHTVIDVGVSYKISARLEVFVNGENIFDENYAANAFGGLIQRGTPASVTGGVRISY